jgi:hypothetical protein
MTPEQRVSNIKSLLEKHREELEKLEQELKANQEPDLSPYSGEGYYYDTTGKITFSANSKGRTIEDYARFPTPEQAEWQAKSDRARRKLHHLMLKLNPKGWKPSSTGGWYNIVIGVGVQAVGFFYSEEARDIAMRELQDELPYFNWFNSPQAKGE